MDTYRFQVVMGRRPDGVFEADVPALPGCHAEGKSIPELLHNIRQVITLYLDRKRQPADPMKSRYFVPGFWDRIN